MPEIISYTRELDKLITNTDHLPRGLGLRYLECTRAHEGGLLIAQKWRRKIPLNPTAGSVFVDMRPEGATRFPPKGGAA